MEREEPVDEERVILQVAIELGAAVLPGAQQATIATQLGEQEAVLGLGPGLDRALLQGFGGFEQRADFDLLRNRAGGRVNSRLKARLKDGSDS